MAPVEPGKCVIFCVISLMAFVMISLATSNLIQFLSPFNLSQHLTTGGYQRSDMKTKSTINDDAKSKLPGLGISSQSKNNESLHVCAQFSFSEGGTWLLCSSIVIVWDCALLLLFVCQHHYMATSEYKQYVNGVVVERSVYLLATAVVIMCLVESWLSLDVYLWYIDPVHWPRLTVVLYIVHVVAWLVLFGEMLLMDVFELLGLKQVYYYCSGLDSPILFKTQQCQRLYKHMRHPGVICLLTILWLYPVMSLDRYILVSIFSLFLLFGHHIQKADYFYVAEMHDRKLTKLRRQTNQ